MAIIDRVFSIVEPLVEPLGLDLVDIEYNGGLLRITVDQEGGLDLDTVAKLSRAVSREMDEQDPITAAYTLEVSSPGLERRLRTPAHYLRAVGEDILVKLGPHVEGDRRVAGKLSAANETSITVVNNDGQEQQIELADVTKARTVFEWGPAPKPGGKQGGKKKSKQGGKKKNNNHEHRASSPERPARKAGAK